jgi:hypothetical protein
MTGDRGSPMGNDFANAVLIARQGPGKLASPSGNVHSKRSKRRADAIRRLGCFPRSAVSWGDRADEELHHRTTRRTREGSGLHPPYVVVALNPALEQQA